VQWIFSPAGFHHDMPCVFSGSNTEKLDINTLMRSAKVYNNNTNSVVLPWSHFWNNTGHSRCDCAMSPSPVCCAILLTIVYYYDVTAPVFTHDDPVRWGRSVLGREVVMMLYAITTLVHGWGLLCLPSSLFFPTFLFLWRGLAVLSILVCVLSVVVWVSATTHGLGGLTGIVHGVSHLLLFPSCLHLLFLNFQLGVRFLLALAEASSALVPSSLDFACDCFFVFSLTFVLCNFLHMCREIAGGLYTLCTNTFSVRIHGPRNKICAKRNFDIYHKNAKEEYVTL